MLFSVKDLKTGEFDRPFPASSVDEAKRMLDLLFRHPENRSLITSYPEDFILVYIGEFDKSTGVLSGSDIETICNLSEIAQQYYKKVDIPEFVNSPSNEEVCT